MLDKSLTSLVADKKAQCNPGADFTQRLKNAVQMRMQMFHRGAGQILQSAVQCRHSTDKPQNYRATLGFIIKEGSFLFLFSRYLFPACPHENFKFLLCCNSVILFGFISNCMSVTMLCLWPG